MKAAFVGERERADINSQVEKVLRGLGNPEPPVRLEEVRELLRLDRQYYSVSSDTVLREFVSKVKVGAQQLAMRPTLLLDIIKKAKLSALWIPDQRRILIDRDVPAIKHRWNETHEVIHSTTEWHKMYLFGDSAKELSISCHQMLEAEANYGAGQLLFLRDRFAIEARELGINVKTVQDLAKKFGNTITSTLWLYVEQMGARLPMVGIVSPHPRRLPDGHDMDKPCKYFIESHAFRQQFSKVSEAAVFRLLIGYCRNARGGSLGETEVVLRDVNGEAHVFWFETFFNTHEALTLAYYLRKQSLVVAF
jgi:Zn-dependent peptidase ImmA (M78 family)